MLVVSPFAIRKYFDLPNHTYVLLYNILSYSEAVNSGTYCTK